MKTARDWTRICINLGMIFMILIKLLFYDCVFYIFSVTKMKTANDWARIRINLGMILIKPLFHDCMFYFFSVTKMKTARDWARIRINIGMIFTTVLACGLMMFLGKRAQARGESVTQMNRDWHAKQKEGSQGK